MSKALSKIKLKQELEALFQEPAPSPEQVAPYLALEPEDAEILYSFADEIRERYCGSDVYLRGIIEFSSYCDRFCAYCGINHEQEHVQRYRMDMDEIVATAKEALGYGYGSVVLQSGEDSVYGVEQICEITRRIKQSTPLAVTLSVGSRSQKDMQDFAKAGADRYLLRFETSSAELYARMHPDESLEERLKVLEWAREAGLQVGSGFLIALPKEGDLGIAKNLLLCAQLKLDMIGIGPFIPSPGTAMEGESMLLDEERYFKTVALLRILNPYSHIPATTAFDALAKNGRNRVLQLGANVFMPNITPKKYRQGYQLYPGKPCMDEDASQCSMCVKGRLLAIGRVPNSGTGHSFRPDWAERQKNKLEESSLT